RFAGAAATRGGRTLMLAAFSSPASTNSSSPCGQGVDVVFMAWRKSQDTMLATNSPVALTFLRVSFSGRSSGVLHENMTTGGAVETRLNCENGARFTRPSASMELIQPMGRGATMALKMVRLKPGVWTGSRNM